MKDILDRAKESEEPIEEKFFQAVEEQSWQRGDNLWRFLERYIGTEARRIIQGSRRAMGMKREGD